MIQCSVYIFPPISHWSLLMLHCFRGQDSTHYLNLLSIFLERTVYARSGGWGLSKNKNTTELYILLGFYVYSRKSVWPRRRVDKDFERLYCWNSNFQAKRGLKSFRVWRHVNKGMGDSEDDQIHMKRTWLQEGMCWQRRDISLKDRGIVPKERSF